jgi:hypothetical protein
MTAFVFFVLEVLLCLAMSLTVITLIKPLLRDVLTETCGTQNRADFWVMFTQLMLVISPLMLVVYFAPTYIKADFNFAYELQQALFRTLLGDFIALSVIGKVIWNSIISPSNQSMPRVLEGDK